jgi:hypothetical protein
MFLEYWSKLKMLLADARIFRNKRIVAYTLIFVLIIVVLNWTATFPVRQMILGVFSLIYYHLLGNTLSRSGADFLLADTYYNRRAMIPRRVVAHSGNLCTFIVAFALLAFLIHDTWVHQSMEPGSLFDVTFVTFLLIFYFSFQGLLYLSFPGWMFFSLPISYNSDVFTRQKRQAFKRAILPAAVLVAVVGVISLAYEIAIYSLVLPTGWADPLSGLSAVLYVFGVAVAMSSVARMASLNDSFDPGIEIDPDSDAGTFSYIFSNGRMMPYSDGGFAFFRFGSLAGGRRINSHQAQSLKKIFRGENTKSWLLVVLVLYELIIIQIFGQILIVSGLEGIPWYLWVGVVIAGFILAWGVAVLWRQMGKVSKVIEGTSPCSHGFPFEFHIVRVMAISFYSIWSMLILGSILSAIAVGMVLNTWLPWWIVIPVDCLMIVGATAVYYVAWLHFRFRKLHGRMLATSDLLPIDPETGRMPSNPFGRSQA